MKSTFAWSVRREVWEHRSVWMAPLGVALLVLVAFLFGSPRVTLGHAGSFSALPPAQQNQIIAMPFSLTAAVILLTGFVVGIFYCLDALHGERRDRSILFWKSMPVSDRTTVLSKAMIPLFVLPAVAFVVALVTQAIVLLGATVLLKGRGIDLALLYDRLHVFPMTVSMLYGIVVHIFWYAPIYALLLMFSTAVRRPFLWVVLPVVVVQILEKIAFGTNHSGDFIKYRLLGAIGEAFKPEGQNQPVISFSQLDPIRYLSTPGLWLGLLAAAAFLYAAIRLRRSREPL